MSQGEATALSAVKQQNPIEWTEKNAFNPLVNAALIEPVNTIARVACSSTGQKPAFLLPSLEVGHCQTYSTEYWLQNGATAIGSIIPYTIAARCAGGSLRTIGRAANMRGAFATVAASEHTAQIVGAGFYDGMRDPRQGETRIGNALGGATAFGIYSAGNSALGGAGLAGRLALRPVIGGIGALSQQAVSHSGEWISGKLPSREELTRTMVTGAVLNSALPVVQEGSRLVVDRANLALGRGVPIDRHLQTDYSTAQVNNARAELNSLLRDNPWARVQAGAAENSYRVRHDLVTLTSGKGADVSASRHSSPLDTLLHELQHRADVKRNLAEPGFKLAADHLRAGREQQSWHVYRNVRMASELRARLAERDGSTRTANVQDLKQQIAAASGVNGKTYEQIWKEEFEHFKQSGGTFRPEIEFALNPEERHARLSTNLIKLLAGQCKDKAEQQNREREAKTFIDAVDARSDLSLKDKSDIYLMCARMLAGESRVAGEFKPKALVEEVLDLVADPNGVKQGRHPTCAPAAIEFITYKVNPKGAAWLVGTTSRFGAYRTHDNSGIVLSDLNRAPELNWNRGHASSLFQTTAVNIHWQRQNQFKRYVDDWYIERWGPSGFLRYERQPTNRLRESPYRLMDYSSLPAKPLISESLYRDIKPEELANPHITAEGINDIFTQINGPNLRRNGVMLPERPPTAMALHDAILQRKRAGELPAILLVDTRNKPFKTPTSSEGGPHAITVVDYDPASSMASTFNPWGQHRSFKLQDLWESTKDPTRKPMSKDEVYNLLRDHFGIELDV